MPECPAPASTQPDKIVELHQLNTLLHSALRTLPQRDQKLMNLYYTNQMTMKQIGTILKVNESRVCQIHKTSLEKLGATLRASGIASTYAFV